MRIAFVSPGRCMHLGGVLEATKRWAYLLKKIGWKVDIITTKLDDNVRSAFSDYTLYELPYRITNIGDGWIEDIIEGFDLIKYILTNYIQDKIPDVIVFGLNNLAFYFRELTKLPTVYITHDYEVFYNSKSWYNDVNLINIALKNYSGDIWTQTKSNKVMLKKNFNKESHVIPIPYIELKSEPKDYVLWAGGGDVVKRPELAVKIAEKLNRPTVFMVGRGITNLNKYIKKSSYKPTIHTKVSEEKWNNTMSKAFAGYHTAKKESFCIAVLDQATCHPVIIPKLQWSSYWDFLYKYDDVNSAVNYINKLESDSFYENQMEIIKDGIEVYSPKEFYNSFNKYVEYLDNQNKDINTKVFDKINEPKSYRNLLKELGWSKKLQAIKYLNLYKKYGMKKKDTEDGTIFIPKNYKEYW